jgi:ComF family protein
MAVEFFCVPCRTPFLNHFPLDDSGRCRPWWTAARGFDSAYCFGESEGALRELIHLFKYRRMKPLARMLSGYLLSAPPREQPFDGVAPMPLHWGRKWQRGFSPAELLARRIARSRRIPLKNAVRRVGFSETHARRTNARRREHVAGAFPLKNPRAVPGQRALLIDDAMTTGAAASPCSLALKRGGAKSATLLALARVDRRLLEPAKARLKAFFRTTEVA